EMVPETYQATRTVYRQVTENQTYTAYRTETVPETRTVTRYVSRQVTEQVPVTTYSYHTVQETVMKNVTRRVPVCKPVTTITRKCVDNGHYETQCVETFLSKCRGKRNPCGHCPEYTSRQVWCSNKQWIECPVTKMVRSYE